MAGNTSASDLEDDQRAPCKYGKECYQKNPDHHKKFKHPRASSEKEAAGPVKTAEESKKHTLPAEGRVESSSKRRKSSSPKKIVVCKPLSNAPPSGSILLRDKIRTADSRKAALKGNKRDLIRQLFLVSMPDDFYSFWEMCKSVKEADPAGALKPIKLKLVGPFDVLADKVKDVYEEDLPDFLRHWRYYYDPPEFQTVLAGEDAQCFHMGYFRDEPGDAPAFVASNSLNPNNPEKNYQIDAVAPNLFAAVNVYMQDFKADPFSKMQVSKLQKTLVSWADKNGFSLDKTNKAMDQRSRKVVAKTFHGAGIVVPVDKKNDVGYRELAASNATLKKLLRGLREAETEEARQQCWERLGPVLTFANIANDECDFGTSLELGTDLFCFGDRRLHKAAGHLLTTAYALLGREEFARVVQVHLQDRREGKDLSIL